MAIAGYGGGVYIGDTAPVKIAEIGSWSLEPDGPDEIDVTSFDSKGWKEYVAGLSGWGGSFEGNFKPDDVQGQVALINSAINKQIVTLELRVNEVVKFTGKAIIKLPNIEVPVDDKVTISFDFTGTGPLTATLSAGV
ncbi:phage tail protein [Caldicoprobacter algeriensis]|uniref:phage tail tube protein n=1 Tax=Caldicoprobacter algeriensis TaxID=699281 RepID=UPI0020797D9B|nr:phage tail tube protein [Caldicoprobacter algeriensis]MCM8901326.1 phage tail protein [Caldicoprobacter algeriensis]